MFNASDIREMLTAKDFKPFVIHTSDGARYEITNHDMVMVARNSIQIGLPSDQEGIAERIVRCAIIHITRIEDLQAA
jgi:anaerobic glycerol-3-phosphate dehydrogenase